MPKINKYGKTTISFIVDKNTLNTLERIKNVDESLSQCLRKIINERGN